MRRNFKPQRLRMAFALINREEQNETGPKKHDQRQNSQAQAASEKNRQSKNQRADGAGESAGDAEKAEEFSRLGRWNQIRLQRARGRLRSAQH